MVQRWEVPLAPDYTSWKGFDNSTDFLKASSRSCIRKRTWRVLTESLSYGGLPCDVFDLEIHPLGLAIHTCLVTSLVVFILPSFVKCDGDSHLVASFSFCGGCYFTPAC